MHLWYDFPEVGVFLSNVAIQAVFILLNVVFIISESKISFLTVSNFMKQTCRVLTLVLFFVFILKPKNTGIKPDKSLIAIKELKKQKELEKEVRFNIFLSLMWSQHIS